MYASNILMEEHRVIERVLNVLRRILNIIERGEIPIDIIDKCIDFVKVFVDRCHHGKEENVLFPVLEAKGIPREGGPIGVMLLEHEQGRIYIKTLSEAINLYRKGVDVKNIIYENITNYINLLTQHIQKEDNILFPMGNSVLRLEENNEVIDGFERIEREKIGYGKHEEYIKLVEKIENEV
jgi:hemerythrin-like domain-containing protein